MTILYLYLLGALCWLAFCYAVSGKRPPLKEGLLTTLVWPVVVLALIVGWGWVAVEDRRRLR